MHLRTRGSRPSVARSAFLLAIAVSTLGGCYRYTGVEILHPQPGAQVRLQLTRAGADALATRLGPGTAAVEGTVRGEGDQGLELTVTQTTRWGDGGTVRWTGEPVTIPRDAIARTEQRTLDRGRSFAAGGVAVLATIGTFLILKATRGGGSGSDSPGGTPPTP